MIIHCTWMSKTEGRCTEAATKDQLGQDGVRWASLCDKHDAALDKYIESGDPKKIMGAWVAAKGGPSAAARSMF